MRGLTIMDKDKDGFLTGGLADILRLSEVRARQSEWEVSDLECLGLSETHELYRAVEMRVRLNGDRLLSLIGDCSQVIDGTFKGYEHGDEEPWVIIRAVDSSAYDIESDDDNLLSRIRQSFKEVKEL
jgi:hypothetical protein